MKVEFKRILCATDLSDFSNQVVYYGMAMAEKFEAMLYLCHVIDMPIVSVHGTAYTFPEDYLDSLKEEAAQKLATLVEGRAVKWESLVVTGPIATSLSELVSEKGIDLSIAATHGRAGLKRLFLGSVTERLIRSIGCPLLTVTPTEHKFDFETVQRSGFKNILVGCDFSPDSSSAMQYGLSLAQEFEATIHLIHVIEPIAYRDKLLPGNMLDSNMKSTLYKNLVDELSDRVEEEAYNWCEIKTECLTGRPYEELVKYTEANAIDLIILGVRGHSLVESMLLGSTTDRVIRRASCPVLSVCPAESTEPSEKHSDAAT